MVIGNRRTVPFNRDLLEVAFTACANASQSPIVAYYAALVVALFLRAGPEADAVRDAVGAHFEPIYGVISSIAATFEDDWLFEALATVAEFFHAEIIPHAVDLFALSTARFVQAARECEESVYAMSDKSLLKIVAIIARHPDRAGPIFEAVLQIAFAAAAELRDGGFPADDILDVIAAVIAWTPAFSPEFWAVVPLLERTEKLDFESAGAVLEQMIWRDLALADRPEVVAHLCEAVGANLDNFAAVAEVAVALVMRIGADLPIAPALIGCLASVDEGWVDVSDLFSALLLTVGAPALEAGAVVELWIENGKFPLFVAAVVNRFDLFEWDAGLQRRLVAAAFRAIRTAAAEAGEEEEEPDPDDELAAGRYALAPSGLTALSVPTPQWFEAEKLVGQFGAFLQALAHARADVIGGILEDEGLELADVLELLPLAAQRILQNSK